MAHSTSADAMIHGGNKEQTQYVANSSASVSQGPPSTRSSKSQSSTGRRDSGCSSYTKQVLTDSHRRTSRTSSKQSSPSTRDTSLSDDHALAKLAINQPSRPRHSRVVSMSKVNTLHSRMEPVDPLTLHQRSRQLFPSSTLPNDTLLFNPPVLQRTQTSPVAAFRPHTATVGRAMTQPYDHGQYDSFDRFVQHAPTRSLESLADPPPPIEPPVTIHWTSDETRRKEYAAIDRNRRGLRGLWNKVVPKFARSGPKSRFYDEKEGSDDGSVRRHRLDLPAGDGR